MANALKNYTTEQRNARIATPQTQRTAGKSEVENNAGGFTFKVSDHDRYLRFLILGTDANTYYVNAGDQTKQSVGFLRNYLKANEADYLATLVDVSVNGRAYKNSPALFALALAMHEAENKSAVRAAVPTVVRTATHLYEFTEYLKGLGGMGRAKRGALADWFVSKDADQLAYQAVKYRQRNGYTLRDVMRIAHPVGVDTSVGDFILGRDHEAIDDLRIIDGFKRMQEAGNVNEVVSLLNEYKMLPWETIPTQFLKDEKVWKTLFYNNQLNGQALLRNVTRLAKVGAFDDLKFAADFAARLTDEQMIARTRLHPINYLNTAVVYNDGQVDRNYGFGRNKTWDVNGTVYDAINDGFHLAFKAVEPAGKRTMLAVDVSGSMASPAMGLDLSCAQVSGALAMTVARTEPASLIRGFTSSGSYWGRGNAQLTDLGITAKTGLATAMKNVQKSNFGGTDCAQPMLWALENKVEIDTFAVITDSETWAGSIKPFQALKQYRDKTGIPARLAVFGVSGNDFTIADPADTGTMDFVGFDSNAPKVFADFSGGRI